ncbi:hypothetical protein GCM10009712_11400 [Pseudarthrobacter sulfonivorans]|nr:hypothetical protein [Pseudarthrobacter sulfonivorans]
MAEIVPSDALECQIEPVGDEWMSSLALINRLLAVDHVSWEDHHPADRIALTASFRLIPDLSLTLS